MVRNTKSLFALVAITFGAISFFSTPAEGLGTVYDIDINKYVGLWYNMYTNFWTDTFTGTDGSECTTAEYGMMSGTNFTVLNAYGVQGEGEVVTRSGYAWVPLQSEPGKVLIKMDNRADATPYWILKLGPIVDNQYEYSVVTDSQALSLFVLARDTETFDINYDAEVTEYLLITGFTSPSKQRVRVYHGDDCTYFSP